MKPALFAMALAAIALTTSVGAAQSLSPLHQLFADERAFSFRENPVAATRAGIRDYDDRLGSVTPESQERRLQANRVFLQRLQGIDRAGLSVQDQINYDLFYTMIEERVRMARWRAWRLPINSDSGFYSGILQLHESHAPRTVRDYETYIARLNDVPRYFRENIANMRQGMRDGWTLPREIIGGVSGVIDNLTFANAEATPLWRPFANYPASVPESERARLTAAGRAAIERSVLTSLAEFRTFFREEYAPRARRTIAAAALPNGRAYYADLVRDFTTLPDATPQEIHRIGLAEVARIRAEMDAIIREVGFQGSFEDFTTFLRTDAQFYATTAEQLLREAAWITREIDAEMPNFFGRIPRTPYTVRAVPAHLAPNYTTGRYSSGALGSAGQYWVNTYALETRPLYVLTALTLHEAAPGHHTQIALARELEGVPEFRRTFGATAFSEGWGLYAERLGVEMGVYRTPYQRFGRLTYEMWRACRLVVDTGMHSMGWSRQRALDYLTANTSLTSHEIRTEIDRYIAWPGQALAYKIGELRIVALRQRAEAALGDRFDIRAFHDAVLENGAVTLPILEQRVDAYIARVRGG